ncbi:hypothetical protein EB093_03240 [bacterium]|nr:hypothetical protein [bacterium]
MSQLAEIRIFRHEDRDHWDAVPVSSYMPVVISGDALIDNMARRIRVNFIKGDPTIQSVRWNIKGDDVGYWIEKED